MEEFYWKEPREKLLVKFFNFPKTINGSWFTINEKCTYASSFLLPLGLLSGMSAADAAIQKKIYGSGRRTLDLALHTAALKFSKE